MGKADPKLDYYADLELDPAADQDEIKKQFKKLARLYHPDRNPGHEVEFVPKFQAVQTAHEILSDPVEKQKYDNARAKLAARQRNSTSSQDQDPYTFRKPAENRPPPPQETQFYPPPPKATPKQRPAYPNPPPPPPPPPTSSNIPPAASASADKLNAFTRRAPPQQSWDRSRFESAQRADAARTWSNMRSGAPPPSPQMSQRPPRQHPTAPRSAADTPSPDIPNVPPPGFPGLSRTASGRKGYAPTTGAGDEPMAPRTSAYAYMRGDRPPVSSQTYSSAGARPPRSPIPPFNDVPQSPLRHARSTDQNFNDRPGLQRSSSRYATQSGERTNINGAGITRSASFRGMPTQRQWEDRGPFGRPTSGYGPQTGPYHNTSPEASSRRKGDYYSSSELTSSDEEVVEVKVRPKATPRQSTRPRGHTYDGRSDSNDPALTGYFPGTNYTRVVNDGQYTYPPQENVRKPFPNMTSPDEERFSRASDQGFRYVNKEDVPVSQVNAQDTNAVPVGLDGQNGNYEGKFFPDHWHAKLDDAQDMFHPTEPPRRKSPGKSSRPDGRATHRARGHSRGNDLESPYPDHHSSEHHHATAEDAESDRSRPHMHHSHHSHHSHGGEYDHNRGSDARDERHPADHAADAMDLDDDGISKRYSHTNGAKGADRIDLSDLSKQAPFAANASGGLNMEDLATNLPFDSRPADGIKLERTQSANLRALNLPKPPQPVVSPSDEQMTKENWLRYITSMANYMKDWNNFNDKMIDHFRHRQEQVTNNMSKNWIGMLGDGPSADDVDSLDGLQAGYAAYMTWLEDDARCRTWWDKANELHRQCLENLGDARHRAKMRFARDKT